MKIDMTMTLADIISSVLSCGALIVALYIGVIQNRINRRMLSIQDGVDIYLRTKYLMDKDDPSKMIAAQIEIRNISATPLSLERYVFNGVERVISPYRLPHNSLMHITISTYHQLIKWIMRHLHCILKILLNVNGKFPDGQNSKVEHGNFHGKSLRRYKVYERRQPWTNPCT